MGVATVAEGVGLVENEHMKHGGLGYAVTEYYAEQRKRPRQLLMGLDEYPKVSEYRYLLEDCGLNAEGICNSVKNCLSDKGGNR